MQLKTLLENEIFGEEDIFFERNRTYSAVA